MSIRAPYALRPNFGILSHWTQRPHTAGDYDYISVDTDRLNMQVRSGDYFVTLATMLEVLSQRLAVDKNPSADDFQRIANELLYLQNYYAIIKKSESNLRKDASV